MDGIAQMGAVAGVLALLLAALWWLRRRGFAAAAPRRGRLLETVERLPLGPQHQLHLVRWGGQALLVGCAPGGCTLLAERPWRELAAAREAAG